MEFFLRDRISYLMKALDPIFEVFNRTVEINVFTFCSQLITN
jgi:hypothetical protein